MRFAMILLLCSSTVFAQGNLATTKVAVKDFPHPPVVITTGDVGKVLVCIDPKSKGEINNSVVPQMFKGQVTALKVTCVDGQLWISPHKD